MAKAFIESALLAHGLASISNKELIQYLNDIETEIAWIEKGSLQIGNIRAFCEFRNQAEKYGRISYFNYEQNLQEKKSGALTASGTMKVCEEFNVPLVITCGIGGLSANPENKWCNDIQALRSSKVSMLATAPKDMFSISETLKGFREANVKVLGCESEGCNGYLFVGNTYKLDGKWMGKCVEESTLYLNKIPEGNRIFDKQLLEEAVKYGKEAAANGELFHPAVNRKLDELTDGMTSKLQLFSLIENIKLAEKL